MLALATKVNNKKISFSGKKTSRYTQEAKDAFKSISDAMREIAATSDFKTRK